MVSNGADLENLGDDLFSMKIPAVVDVRYFKEDANGFSFHLECNQLDYLLQK